MRTIPRFIRVELVVQGCHINIGKHPDPPTEQRCAILVPNVVDPGMRDERVVTKPDAEGNEHLSAFVPLSSLLCDRIIPPNCDCSDNAHSATPDDQTKSAQRNPGGETIEHCIPHESAALKVVVCEANGS